MVKIQCFHCQGQGSIPGLGADIPQAANPGQKKAKKANKLKMLFKDENKCDFKSQNN